MKMVCLLFALSVFFVRILSGYDSRYQKGKYLSIKSTVIGKIALDSMSIYARTSRLKKDRNKMSVLGVYLYSALAVILAINVVFLIIPDIPCENWVIDTDTGRFIVFANTLNNKISAISILLFFLSIIVCFAFTIISSTKEITPKWIKIFVWGIAVFMILVAVLSTIYLLIDCISSFL